MTQLNDLEHDYYTKALAGTLPSDSHGEVYLTTPETVTISSAGAYVTIGGGVDDFL